MAVPLTVYVTVVATLTGLLKVMVNSPSVLGSEAWVVAAILTFDTSSSAMVTVADAGVPNVTAVSVLAKVRITVSPPVSTRLSSITPTGIVMLVVLAGILILPVKAV